MMSPFWKRAGVVGKWEEILNRAAVTALLPSRLLQQLLEWNIWSAEAAPILQEILLPHNMYLLSPKEEI